MASSYNLNDLKRTRLAARDAMAANEAHQQRVREHIQELEASLENLDAMLSQIEKSPIPEKELEDEEGEFTGCEIKCIQVEGAMKVQSLAKSWTDEDSPFHKDAMQRERYLSLTQSRPWRASERKNLKLIVTAELKRLYALELQASGLTDTFNPVQLKDNSFYETRDASTLDWFKIANAVASRSADATQPRSALDCKVQWLGWDRPQIKKTPWSFEEIVKLNKAVASLRISSSQDGEGEREEEEEEGQRMESDVRVNWSDVSEMFDGTRTASQCLIRWLKPGGRFAALNSAKVPPEARNQDEPTTPSIAPDDSAAASGSKGPMARESSTRESSTVLAESSSVHWATKGKPEGNMKRAWTKKEDEALRQAVQTYGKSNWMMVASVLPFPRTAKQCSDRYRQSVDPNIRRGAWTRDEDDLLSQAVRELGMGKWKDVAALVPGRTNAQCRERWVNHLDPSVSKDEWTVEEDQALVALKESDSAPDWPTIATSLPGRTDNQCLRRYKHLMGDGVNPRKEKRTKTQKARFSIVEDTFLIKYKQEHPLATWKDVAAASPGQRTPNQCSGRWKYLKGKGSGPGETDEEDEQEDELEDSDASYHGDNLQDDTTASDPRPRRKRAVAKSPPPPPEENVASSSTQVAEAPKPRPKPRPRKRKSLYTLDKEPSEPPSGQDDDGTLRDGANSRPAKRARVEPPRREGLRQRKKVVYAVDDDEAAA